MLFNYHMDDNLCGSKRINTSVIYYTLMTLHNWRTTKLPEEYFAQIKSQIESSRKYFSVSEFIRKAVEEKLSKEKHNTEFLTLKDIVFNESKIEDIHEIISHKFKIDSKGLLKKDIRKVIEKSLDTEMVTFLAKFMKNFAKYHPFKDGNKRTLILTIDAFLRLNNMKLKLNANKDKETEEEIFIWQNSAQQKSLEEIKNFITQHIKEHISNKDIDEEIANSIEENKILLERLSR